MAVESAEDPVTDQKIQIRRFYDALWNRHDKRVIPEVLHSRVRFRGSLGETRYGWDGFEEYLDMVHRALGDYRCEIEALVSEPPQAFARMQFSGVHRGELLGYRATGEQLNWAGAALFSFEQDRIVDLWVLGDLKSLEMQLQSNESRS